MAVRPRPAHHSPPLPRPQCRRRRGRAAAYALLKTNYLVAVVPQKQTWANRKVFLLTIRRRSNHLLARKLWMDAATGQVLKRESYRDLFEGGEWQAKLAVTVAYTDINFHPSQTRISFDPARLARPAESARRGGSARRREAGPRLVVPRQLGGWLTPASLAGYRLVGAAVTERQAASAAPALLRWPEPGLAVRAAAHADPAATRVPGTMRPLRVGSLQGHVISHASLTAINWDTAAFNLTLMGEIAQRTLQQLAATGMTGRP